MAGESQLTPKNDPDPSVLTTEQLDKGLDALKELMHAELKGLEDLTLERFKSVNLEFQGRDKALEAAFRAQTETAGKTENNLKEAIDKLEKLAAANNQSTSDKVDDVKERVGKIESIKVGGQQQLAGLYALAGFFLVVVLIVGGIFAFKT